MKIHPIISCVSIWFIALWLTSCGAVQEPVSPWPKRVMITNDDGIDSPGIKALALAFAQVADTYVVAPLEDQSGTGHNMIHMETDELAVESRDFGEGIQAYAVDGLPADCVVLALTGIMRDNPPDLVVSGINSGPNVGTAWVASGTIGAARIAALAGIPAIAASGTMVDSVDVAAQWVVDLAHSAVVQGLQPPQFLTVSFPRVSASLIKGIRVTEHTDLDEISIFERIPNARPDSGRDVWKITGEQWFEERRSPESDAVLLNQGYVAVVPMRADEHDYALLADLQGQVERLPDWPTALASKPYVQFDEHQIPRDDVRSLKEVALYLQSHDYGQVVEIEYTQNCWNVEAFDGNQFITYAFEPHTLDLLKEMPTDEPSLLPSPDSQSISDVLARVEAEGYTGIVRIVDFMQYKDQLLWGVGVLTDTGYRQIGLDPLTGEIVGEK